MLRGIRKPASLLIVFAAFHFSALAALAHAIGFSCKVLGDMVRVEAYFSDDTPAVDAQVFVRNEKQEIVAQGRTDERGVWTFARPPAAPYEITVDAGAGHRLMQRLTVPEPSALSNGQESAVNGGPDRQDFTRIPWTRLAIGVAIITALAAAWLGRARIARYKESRS